MASDGRKQKLPSWSQRVPGRADPGSFPAPDISAVTLPGLPEGLFPRAALDTGVTLEVPRWQTIPTDPNDYETITLQFATPGGANYVDVVKVDYVPGTTDLPVKITIPSDFLLKDENEGAFNMRYEHENYLGTKGYSDDVLVFIDKVPPNGTAAPGKLTFTITPPFTDANLTGTDVECVVPLWTGAATGDLVAFAWIKDSVPEDPDDIVPIAVVTLGTDRVVKIPVALIRSLGDGNFCAVYTVFDKALNRSRISQYDVIPVAIGEFPPMPYPALNVPEADDGQVTRADALQGVFVEFQRILHAKPTDQIAIIWGGKELSYRTPVGSNPPSRMSVAVDWAHMRDVYGAAVLPVLTSVEYTLYRGSVALGGASDDVLVDFSMTGPVNPNPEPGNPSLHQLEVLGESDTPNVLIASDENKPIVAKITLYDPLTAGDVLQVYWNKKPIGTPYPIDIANDIPGTEIEIQLDWGVIRGEGNHPEMPATYTLTNPDFTNPQEPEEPTQVDITFFTITLPAAIPQNLFRDRLTCVSLHFEDSKIGFQYLIPPSDYLKAGMTVKLQWNASHTYASPVDVPGAGKAATYGPITQDEADKGFLWFIEPYATHLLPTWASATNQIGKGEVIYTFDVAGVPTASTPSDTQVGLTQGSGTCDLKPPIP